MSVAATEAGSVLNKAVRTSTIVYALLAVGLLSMWPTLLTLTRDWSQKAEYSHGSLIALISVAWMWTVRHKIESHEPRPTRWLGGILIVVLVAWAIAFKGNNDSGQQFLLPPVLWLGVACAFGWRVALPIAAPLGYLYCAIPLWDYAIPLLQKMAVFVTQNTLGLMGIPVSVEDNMVKIPEGTFEIAEGCAGKRYLLAVVALAYLAAAISHLKWPRRILFIVVSAILALIANWTRVVMVIYAGHVTNMQHYWVRVEHLTLGWIIFIPLFIAILAVLAWLHRGARAQGHLQRNESERSAIANNLRSLQPMMAIVALLMCLPFLPRLSTAMQAQYSPRLGVLPLSVDRWQGPLPVSAQWHPQFAGQSDERQVSYRSQRGDINVYMNVFGPQTPQRELVHYTNSALPQHWTAHSRRTSFAPMSASTDELPAEIEAKDVEDGRWLIAYAYKVGPQLTGNPLVAQLLYGARALFTAPPTGMIALAVHCDSNCAAARSLLREFWRAQGGVLVQTIPDVWRG